MISFESRSRGEEALPLRHSVGELAQLTGNKTNKSIVNPREAPGDSSATVRATIATGSDKPLRQFRLDGEVTRDAAPHLVSVKTRSGLTRENMPGDIRVSRRTFGRIERYNAGRKQRACSA